MDLIVDVDRTDRPAVIAFGRDRGNESKIVVLTSDWDVKSWILCSASWCVMERGAEQKEMDVRYTIPLLSFARGE